MPRLGVIEYTDTNWVHCNLFSLLPVHHKHNRHTTQAMTNPVQKEFYSRNEEHCNAHKPRAQCFAFNLPKAYLHRSKNGPAHLNRVPGATRWLDLLAALRRLLGEMHSARPSHQVCNQSNYFCRDTQCICNKLWGFPLQVLRSVAFGHIVCQNVRTAPKRGANGSRSRRRWLDLLWIGVR